METFDHSVAKFTPSRAITRRPRGCWGWRVAKVSGQARLARTMLPWPSQKLVPRRRAKSKVCSTGLAQLAESARTRVCRRLRAILGRGQGNFHLQNAYARCGIQGRPNICIPGGTRMIVYSSGFLRQSFAHFKARYEALCAWDIVLQGLAEDPSNKGRARHRKRREMIVRVGQRLARASHV